MDRREKPHTNFLPPVRDLCHDPPTHTGGSRYTRGVPAHTEGLSSHGESHYTRGVPGHTGGPGTHGGPNTHGGTQHTWGFPTYTGGPSQH